MHLTTRWTVVALLAAALSATEARADDDAAEAKRLYLSGTKHFNLAEYDAALNDFKEGYRHKDDPVFLYDIAQCYRLIKGHEEEAIKFYRSYLRSMPSAPNRGEVDKKIEALEQALAQQEKARATPPSTTMNPSDPSNPAVTATAQSTPVVKKWWLWTVVGGVVVVGAGVGVGLGVGLQPRAPMQTNFPPVDF